MDADAEQTKRNELLDTHVAQLSEHFDSVRIFVTLHKGGEEQTGAFTRGKGNFYAQLGQVNEWTSEMDQLIRNETMKKE